MPVLERLARGAPAPGVGGRAPRMHACFPAQACDTWRLARNQRRREDGTLGGNRCLGREERLPTRSGRHSGRGVLLCIRAMGRVRKLPWGTIFLPWNWTPRQRPSEREVRQSMQRLVADWHSIVGNELGEITRPLRLTGRKKRRLVVLAIASGSPPWGTWSERWYGRKDTFSRFRAAINDVLAPHQVDHIDFVTADRLE